MRQSTLFDADKTLEERFATLQRMIPPAEAEYASHNLHPYPARFLPHFPRLFIAEYTRPGDLVLDPMCGSGTGLIEAALTGRAAVGVDVDPIAILTARVATRPLEAGALTAAWSRLHQAFAAARAAGEAARVQLPDESDYPNHRLWFRPDVLQELLLLRNLIWEQVPDEACRDFALLCLSAVVKPCSNADPRDIFPERDRGRPVRERQDVFLLYSAAWQSVSRKALAFAAELDGPPQVQVLESDARSLPLPDGCADLAVTSPPYAYALDYARVHQLSTLLMIMDAAGLRAHRQRYIGRDRIPAATPLGSFDGFDFAEAAVREVHAADRKWGLVLYTYLRDMTAVTRELYRSLRPGGRLVYIIGNSTIKRTAFGTGDVLRRICEQAGFDTEKVLERPYYAYRMARKRNTHSNTIKSDLFLVVRRPRR